MADIIGKGWKFPIRVNAKGGLQWSEGVDRIRQSIWIIISTSFGERVMRPKFGAGAADYVFESNSPAKRAELANAIRNALATWEPRIEVGEVSVEDSPGQPSLVLARVNYRVLTTNDLFNLVYPLYLEEGLG